METLQSLFDQFYRIDIHVQSLNFKYYQFVDLRIVIMWWIIIIYSQYCNNKHQAISISVEVKILYMIKILFKNNCYVKLLKIEIMLIM